MSTGRNSDERHAQFLRMEALRMALQATGRSEQVLPLAAQFLAFMKGDSSPDPHPAA